MHHDHRRIRIWLTAGSMTALALVAMTANEIGSLGNLRTGLHDLLSPGRLVLLAISSDHTEKIDSVPAPMDVPLTASESEVLRRGLLESEVQRRQLMIENARLRNQLKQQTIVQQVDSLLSPDGISVTGKLSQFGITPATVISSRGLPDPLQDLIIDAGLTAGVTRSELVVDGSGLLLDKGTDDRIAAGDRVLAGAVVVGRIEKAGRWVSLVQSVTDPGFSARVQLMRNSSQGQYFGAEGILTGVPINGDQRKDECVINGVPYTEAVSVGDEVISADIDGTRGPRLYFGRVTHAEFLDGGQWLIQVHPAVADMPLEQVGIVRLELNQHAQGPGLLSGAR